MNGVVASQEVEPGLGSSIGLHVIMKLPREPCRGIGRLLRHLPTATSHQHSHHNGCFAFHEFVSRVGVLSLAARELRFACGEDIPLTAIVNITNLHRLTATE
jgi:hypothetical protein